jgi:phosphate transport system substrate-binding protein
LRWRSPEPEFEILNAAQMPTACICINVGQCDKADRRELILIPETRALACPQCGWPLMVAESRAQHAAPRVKGWLIFAGLIAIAIAGTLAIVFGPGLRLSKNSPPQPAAAAPSAASAVAVATPPAQPSRKVILSFEGATTIGSRLVPELAKAFLLGKGASDVRQLKGARDQELSVEGRLRNDAAVQAIDIRTHGTAIGFQGLNEGSCDIAMSVRKAKPEELAAFTAAVGGDLSSDAAEHVLALDGVAFVVNRANPTSAVKMQDLAKILSGEITDWRQVGGRPGPINVFALNKRRATYDFVNEAVLKPYNKEFVSDAKDIDDNETLAAAIAQDPAGIGFVALAYIQSNKALALGEKDGPDVRPTERTVKTEQYPMTRRLFLYARPSPSNANVAEFLNFVLSDAGQEVVKQTGFVDLRLALAPATPEQQTEDPRGAWPQWRDATAGAAELPTHLHFREGSVVLDTRAHRDIGRIAATLSAPGFEGARLVLIGFSDNAGSRSGNLKLSEQRAQAVQRELEAEGLTVEKALGLGAEAPYTSNQSANGRALNRRVEVWVRK